MQRVKLTTQSNVVSEPVEIASVVKPVETNAVSKEQRDKAREFTLKLHKTARDYHNHFWSFTLLQAADLIDELIGDFPRPWPATHRTDAKVAISSASNWPVGCHDTASCTRHSCCMYVGCVHSGHDIKAEIVKATSFMEAALTAQLQTDAPEHVTEPDGGQNAYSEVPTPAASKPQPRVIKTRAVKDPTVGFFPI